MGKVFKTLISGAVLGVAAGYFLSTKKGQEFKEKAVDFAKDYKDNPEVYNQAAKEKAAVYKDAALHTVKDYKEKFETGELTKDDVIENVKDKAVQASEFANDQVLAFRDKFAKVPKEGASQTQAEVDDIVIDYPADDGDEETPE
ncbi:YtxH domain-containing protein [Streptococcus dentasini]